MSNIANSILFVFCSSGLSTTKKGNKIFNRLTMIGTDSIGNYKWKKDYGGPNFSYLLNNYFRKADLVQDNNYFYYIGIVKDAALREFGVLIKFNYNGDSIWQKIYRDTFEDLYPHGITKSVDNGFLITGSFQNWTNNTNPCLILKTDANGNELWRKRIHKSAPDFNLGNSVVQDSLTKKIIVVGGQYIGTSSSWDYFGSVIIMDSLGTMISQTSFNNANGGAFGAVIQTADKNFVTCGSWSEAPVAGSARNRALIVKFDINGNLNWSKKYGSSTEYNQLTHLKEIPNRDIVLFGNRDTIQNSPPERIIKIIMTKIDEAGGLKWSKFIGSTKTKSLSEGPLSLNLTADNGFLSSNGYYYKSNPRPYSIIKVDSSGCDTVAHWCQSVALGTDNFNKLTGYTFEFYPNPANDEVNYKLQATLDYKFSISIRDVSGRVVHEMQPSPSQALTFNTASYPPGIYFIALYANGQCLETKKLVILR